MDLEKLKDKHVYHHSAHSKQHSFHSAWTEGVKSVETPKPRDGLPPVKFELESEGKSGERKEHRQQPVAQEERTVPISFADKARHFLSRRCRDPPSLPSVKPLEQQGRSTNNKLSRAGSIAGEVSRFCRRLSFDSGVMMNGPGLGKSALAMFSPKGFEEQSSKLSARKHEAPGVRGQDLEHSVLSVLHPAYREVRKNFPCPGLVDTRTFRALWMKNYTLW